MFTKSDFLAKALCFIMLLLVSSSIFAQKQVTGKITDANNQPVIGATVIVKGSNMATQTNNDGSFSISVPNDNAVLVVSSIGFDTQEISVAGQSNLTIGMRAATSSLNEVVVTGYTTQRKKDIIGGCVGSKYQRFTKYPSCKPRSTIAG